MELTAAVAFAVSHQPEAPLAAIVEQLSHHLPEGSTVTLQAENARLHALVRKCRLEIEQLKRKSSVIHKEEAAASPALQALRDRTQAILAELQAAESSTAVGMTSLPEGLKDFTPLANEPEIAAIAAGLHELELEVARRPTSESAQAALREQTERLALTTQSKIAARTTEARQQVPATAEELENTWMDLNGKLLEGVKVTLASEGAADVDVQSQAVVDQMQAAWEKASIDEKPRLLREAMRKADEEESFVPLVKECAAAIIAGNRDFQKIYHAVYEVICGGETDGVEAAKAAITALGKAVRGDPNLLQQRDEAAETATLLADAAGARPAFAELVRCVSKATGARLEMALLGEMDGHGREGTGLKATKRVVEKAALRPGEGCGRTERVCDVVRAMLVAKDMRTIGAIAEALRALHVAGLIEVRRIKDRFTQPSGGGWRDLMVNLVVLGGDGEVQHVCEVQIAHKMMLTARKGLPGHEVYAVQRNAAEFIESCGLEVELRRAMVGALEKEGKTRTEILSEFEDGWISEDADWVAAAGSKERLLKNLEISEEGRLTTVHIFRNRNLTSLPENLGEFKMLQTLQLLDCVGLLSLPEQLGDCSSLHTLLLTGCFKLLSLPERLGECGALQTLGLDRCKGLLSLPDLSGLAEQLQICGERLVDHLQPWAASGYKWFTKHSDVPVETVKAEWAEYVALYSFEGLQGEGSMTRGDRMLVSSEEAPEGWLLASRAADPAVIGYVPLTYVEKVTG